MVALGGVAFSYERGTLTPYALRPTPHDLRPTPYVRQASQRL